MLRPCDRTASKVGSIQQMLNNTLLPKRDALVKVRRAWHGTERCTP
jgi:hypothetical protein